MCNHMIFALISNEHISFDACSNVSVYRYKYERVVLNSVP
jgi:hypothetical protein